MDKVERVFSYLTKEGKAESKKQQRLMGMAYAYRQGDLDTSDMPDSLVKKVKNVADSMSKEDLKEYAETKRKGKPEKKASFDKAEKVFKKVADRYKIEKEGQEQNSIERGLREAGKIVSEGDDGNSLLNILGVGGLALGGIAGWKKFKGSRFPRSKARKMWDSMKSNSST